MIRQVGESLQTGLVLVVVVEAVGSLLLSQVASPFVIQILIIGSVVARLHLFNLVGIADNFSSRDALLET